MKTYTRRPARRCLRIEPIDLAIAGGVIWIAALAIIGHVFF